MKKILWEGYRPCAVCEFEYCKPVQISISREPVAIETIYLCENGHCFSETAKMTKGVYRAIGRQLSPVDYQGKEFSVNVKF